MDIQKYKKEFENLRPNRTNTHVRPHKACMLLAVIDLIDQGIITTNQIRFNTYLREAFSERFVIFKKGNDKDDPALPFFYLSSSSFWHLVAMGGMDTELQKRLDKRQHGSTRQVETLIDYVYLDPELYQILSQDVYRAVFAEILERNLISNEEIFKKWGINIGKSPKTIANYSTAIKGALSTWTSDASGISTDLYQIHDLAGLHEVREKLATYQTFIDRDSVGKNMYSAALNLYEKFLEEQTAQTVTQDIAEIENRNLDATEKETLVSARRGQGLFRRRVLNEWQGVCAVTGYTDDRFILASHIKPWRQSSDSERLDRFNGLPLIPSLDKAFDLGYISFDSTGLIVISSELELPEVLGVNPELRIKGRIKHFEYLEYHRSELFRS